mmetsp:Transcript_90715/g.194572  ORF Transcript_90715/g.194572 Transcript_90715/m.194572 type:complete len:86 (+) Transcript_90715:945-1202(+)
MPPSIPSDRLVHPATKTSVSLSLTRARAKEDRPPSPVQEPCSPSQKLAPPAEVPPPTSLLPLGGPAQLSPQSWQLPGSSLPAQSQ